jgi:hypothetical protein
VVGDLTLHCVLGAGRFVAPKGRQKYPAAVLGTALVNPVIRWLVRLRLVGGPVEAASAHAALRVTAVRRGRGAVARGPNVVGSGVRGGGGGTRVGKRRSDEEDQRSSNGGKEQSCRGNLGFGGAGHVGPFLEGRACRSRKGSEEAL